MEELEAMQAINATVRNLELALGFFGAPILGAAALALRAGYEPARNRANALRTGLSMAAFALLVGAVTGDRGHSKLVDSR